MNETVDLFGHGPRQPSLFGEAEGRMAHPAQESLLPDPDDVRQRLHAILNAARAAERMPWDARRARTYQTIFPQMANWLPDEEAEQLRFEFTREIARLNQAA
jgi:hypothetical protein